jgi:hypothetical protein
MGSPPPGIGAEATRKALFAGEVAAANHNDVAAERAARNEADLQELEHAEYYPDEPHAPAKRSFLDRLLGRGTR